MPAIYISYRKDDTQGAAAHLYKNLCEAFGRKAVFMDVATSQPGRDVRDVVEDHLVSCAAVLIVIGKGWVDARDESGQRRLDNPSDLVRIETAAALAQELPVIPVLVQGAPMLQPGELPPDVADLAFRNPVTLLQSQWGSDVETLVTLLRSLVQGQASGAPTAAPSTGAPPDSAAPAARVARPQPVGKPPWRTVFAATAAIVVMAAGVYAFMASRPRPVDKASAPPPAPAATAKAPAPAAPATAIATAPAPAPATARSPTPSAEPAKVAAEPRPSAAAKAEAAAAPASPVTRTAAAQASTPSAVSAAAKVLSLQKWTLNSGGCGAGPLTVTGVARFSIEKTSDAIVVTEEFRGSGGGFDVVVSGQVEFGQEQPSYEIPTSGQWTSAGKTFKSSGLDRVTTSGDGLTPRSANLVKLQSLCG